MMSLGDGPLNARSRSSVRHCPGLAPNPGALSESAAPGQDVQAPDGDDRMGPMAQAVPEQSGGLATSEQVDEQVEPAKAWVTLVWDDPVNLMSYVTHVFTSYFKYPRAKAEQLMLQVHNEGKAVVSSGTREEMERDVAAMHTFGLWATVDRAE